MTSPQRSPRLVGVLLADLDRDPAARIKYGLLLEALARRFGEVTLCDASLRGPARWLAALRSFRPDRRRWREHFHKNAAAFRQRSRRAAARIAELADEADVVLQIGTLLDVRWGDSPLPSVIYTDYTTRLSARHPEAGRSPFTPRQLEHWLRLEERAFRRAAHVCARSEFVRANLIDEYGLAPDSVTAIGGGVNFEPLPELGDRARGTGDPPTALFIGQELFRKGGDLLLRAFGETRRRVPGARLLLVTGDPIPPGLPLEGVTVLPLDWDRERISSLYRQADLFVLPSRLETWGDVLLEAMAHGVPCLGVAGESMEDIITPGRTGALVPPEDPAALAEALVELLPWRARLERWGRMARAQVETQFTWEKVVERLAPALESAASAATRSSGPRLPLANRQG